MCASPLNSLIHRPAESQPPAPILPADGNHQRARVRSLSDQIFYNLYSFYNPAPCVQREPFHFYEPRPLSYEFKIPKRYEFVREWLLTRSPEDLSSPGARALMANLEAYADPALREERAREYFEMGITGRAVERELNQAKLFCVLSFCNKELHDLYRSEYKPKIRDMLRDNEKWIYDIGVSVDDEIDDKSLVEHMRGWDQMDLSTRAKKICYGGLPSRYLATALITTAAVSTLFFLARWR